MRDDLKSQLDAIERLERRRFLFVPVVIIVGSVLMAIGLHGLGFRAENPIGPDYVRVEVGTSERARVSSQFN